MVLSILYAAVNVVAVKRDLQRTGSWSQFWHQEWESGKAVTGVLNTGLFQLFMLALGWSAWFRLRSREMAHLRLRRSEQKYRSIINHAGEAIFLLDRQGQVLEWNKVAENLFHLSRRSVLNRSIRDLDLGIDLDFDRVFAEAERIQRGLTYEVKLERDDAEAVLLKLMFSLILPGAFGMASGVAAGSLPGIADTGDGQGGAFVVIARDITSERQLETRMSETEKLAGIGQLAAGIAHQLNTPLGSILLSAQMLEETIEDEDDVEDIRRIIRQTEQCRSTIKGLLNFARPTGHERRRLNLAEVIRDTSYLMEKNLKVAGVDLVIDRSPDFEPWVYGNRNELEQVFFNLLANALDAMPDGGAVNVRFAPNPHGETLVEFIDSGEGVPDEYRDRIFLPFFTTKDYGKGTGLGLSIVARIVHEHGGRIELDNRNGRGARFRLWFPQARTGDVRPALIDDLD